MTDQEASSNVLDNENVEAVFDVLAVYDTDPKAAYALTTNLKAVHLKPIGRSWPRRIDSWAKQLQCDLTGEQKRLVSKSGQQVLLRNQWDDAIKEKLEDIKAQHAGKANSWIAKKVKEAVCQRFYTGEFCCCPFLVVNTCCQSLSHPPIVSSRLTSLIPFLLLTFHSLMSMSIMSLPRAPPTQHFMKDNLKHTCIVPSMQVAMI